MLIHESHVDIDTSTTPMRVFLFHPVLSSGLKARFPAILVFTEIYQVTAPITRLCRQLAGRGFIVASCSSYHEFMGPEALAYDDDGILLHYCPHPRPPILGFLDFGGVVEFCC
jgi:dienelactone hydrolase